MKNKHKNIIYVIGIALLIVQMVVLVIKCQPDNCTQPAFKEKFKVGMTLKSTSSKSMTAEGFTPSTRETPLWLDWEGRNLDLNNVNGWTLAGMGRNADSSYYVKSWVGFRSSITIPQGKEFHVRSLNMIIKGDIHGTGTLIFESYQEGRAYNSPIGAKLVVEGSIDSGLNLVLNDNATVEYGKPLSDSDGGLGEKIKVEVPCDWELPTTIADENGVKWRYTEYK